jgi:hypothetical protein
MADGATLAQTSTRSRRPDPAEIGRRVLAGLAKGRLQALALAQARAVTILYLALADREAGRPTRGRARRVARQSVGLGRFGGPLSESQVRRIIVRSVSRMRD